jgi:hypothetical protein
MVVPLLRSLIAEMLFQSVTARHRAYEAEIDRYLEARGFRPHPEGARSPALTERARAAT